MTNADFFVKCRLPGSDASTADLVFFLNTDKQFVGADASQFIIEPWVGSKQQEEVTEYISKEEYLERVEAAVDAIRSGEMNKVVLSRTVVTSIHHDQAERVYASLKESYPQAFVYWLRHPEHGEWLGATPELLLSKRANHFEVMSLAGTMPAALKVEIQGAIEKMLVPVLNSTGSNQKQVADARRARVNAAIFLAVISPEYQVQK